jgi:ketosteroid isomerase-like protein
MTGYGWTRSSVAAKSSVVGRHGHLRQDAPDCAVSSTLQHHRGRVRIGVHDVGINVADASTTISCSDDADPRILGSTRRAHGPTLGSMTARRPEQLHALLESAFRAGDLDAFLALHEEDAAVLVPPDGRRVSGLPDIRRALEALFATPKRARMEVIDTLESGGLALTSGRWSLGEMTGRGAMVSRRGPDGTWRILLDNPLFPG